MAESDEQVQENHEEQEEKLPAPDDLDMAACNQDEELQDGLTGTAVLVPVEDDGAQRHLPVLPSPHKNLFTKLWRASLRT